MDEFVRATDFDTLADAYERLRALYEAELHHSFHRKPPREPQPKIVTRERREPLDVAEEQHPL